ncbi:MAG: electron transfer flavoprotein subunit beta/FixA family protein [Deltaproteobacteria bacterium]|nr:electron transfer flavoprotein subunit beta/FixA family protein [Deltaproteobacteria bacterium]
MKTGVLFKEVPATDTRVRIDASGSGIVEDDVKWEVNPYDEFALEEALRLLDAKKATEVVIVCLGPAHAEQRIRDGLARGATRAVWLKDPAYLGGDSLATARALASAVRAEGIDLLLAGKVAVDDDNAQVPAMVAELLGWAQVTFAGKLEIDGTQFKATRDVGRGARAVVEGALPAVVTCDKGMNVPRYASLPGIMKARSKPIVAKAPADLGLDPATLGKAGSQVVDTNWTLPPARPAGRVLQGETPEAVVKELVRLLREEAKVL